MKFTNIQNASFFIILMVMLSMLTYSLNFCNKIYQCSLVVITISFLVNIISELYNRKAAITGLSFAVLMSIILLWNFNYKLNGNTVSGIVIISLFGVLVSNIISSYLFVKYSTFSFYKRNSISLISCAAIDTAIMSLFFINKYTLTKIITITLEEILFKGLYCAFICMFIVFVSIFITITKQHKIAKYKE